MKKIKLYNRDGANLWLENIKDNQWQLKVDKNHEYCLQYIRVIGNYPKEIEAIDPSGGPFLSKGDILDGNYEIVDFLFLNGTTLILNERNNNSKNNS